MLQLACTHVPQFSIHTLKQLLQSILNETANNLSNEATLEIREGSPFHNIYSLFLLKLAGLKCPYWASLEI